MLKIGNCAAKDTFQSTQQQMNCNAFITPATYILQQPLNRSQCCFATVRQAMAVTKLSEPFVDS